jgi:twitching motility protein PilT
MSSNINELLKYAVETKASDLHLSSGSIPMVRIDGVMQTLQLPTMTNEDMLKISQEVLNDNQSKILTKQLEIDFSYELENFGRFRVNFFNQINGLAAAFRIIPSSILSSEELSIPPIINQLAFLDKGLVLLTGPTGSGKSTTLAAMINHINENKNKHIITVEDPVEYYHSSIKSLINQRELGHSTHSFANALKSALREDPDVILVGEMRDLETIQLALTAAETGHLVLSTLHTSNAVKTIDRIIDVFPAGQKDQIRSMLSESLEAVIAQKLLPNKTGKGRIPASEILIVNSADRN